MLIPFSEWVPDAAALGNPGSLLIVNAIPGITSYKPIGEFSVLTDSLDARPRGAIDAKDREANVFQYAGDAAKLYQLSGTSWTDVSISGGYTTGDEENWEFARWKDDILATNFSDSPQTITMGGANFADLTTAFRCRHIAVIGDRVIAANTFDASDGAISDRIRWSGFDDATSWTVDPSTGADARDLNVGGAIQKVFGGQYGLIISESSTFRMTPHGSLIFRIDEVLPGTGTFSAGSCTELAEKRYFMSERGIVEVTGGTGVRFPGAGKVDQWILRDIDQSNLHRVSSTSDPRGGRVAWAYPGAGSTLGIPNRIVIYDSILDKWALIQVEVEMIWRASGVGFTLEELDNVSTSIDDIPASLDSSRWKGGGIPLLAAFDTTNAHGMFDGPPMAAGFVTKEVQLNAGQKSMLNSFRPLIDGGTVTADVGTRDSLSDAIVFGPGLTQKATGKFTARSNGRYHTIRLSVSGEWNDAIGVEANGRPSGRRGG